MNREDFDGPEQSYIVARWDTLSARWVFRPVMGGALLTDQEIVELGLDAPLVEIPGLAEPQAFSQRDARWAAVRLGASSYTMGSAGCAVTACAMVASAVDPAMTPLALVTWLNANGGFTSGGLLYWAKVAEYVDALTFVSYHLWRDVAADLAHLARALEIGPQVVQVDFVPGGALNSHFVTALAFTEDGKDLVIIDPWTGERGTLLALYGATGWSLSRAVYAMAEFGYS